MSAPSTKLITGLHQADIPAQAEEPIVQDTADAGAPAEAESSYSAAESTQPEVPAQSNPTTIFRKVNPAEAKKVWEYLKREFGVQERFHAASARALDGILAEHSADEFISFIEDLKEAFPETFRKDVKGYFAEMFRPMEICRETSAGMLRSEGVEVDSQGQPVRWDYELGDRYIACEGYNVFGMDGYEVESTLDNLAMIQKLGPDVVPFLKKYSKIMGDEFALNDAHVFISPYRMEQDSPGLWERYDRLHALFKKRIGEEEKKGRNVQWVKTSLTEIAQLGQTAMERVIAFNEWAEAHEGMELGCLSVLPHIQWEGERYDKFMAVLDWMEKNGFFIRLDGKGLWAITDSAILDGKGVLSFAERILAIFKPERIPYLFEEIPRLMKIEKAGVPMEEIRDWQLTINKKAPPPLYTGPAQSLFSDYYDSQQRHLVGLIPAAIYENEASDLKRTWDFTRAIFDEDPQIAALLDERGIFRQGWETEHYFRAISESLPAQDLALIEKAARAIPKIIRLQLSYAPTGKEEEILLSRISNRGVSYINNAMDKIWVSYDKSATSRLLDFNAEEAKEDLDKLRYLYSRLCEEPELYMAYSPGLIEFMLMPGDRRKKALGWDAMAIAEEIYAEDYGRGKRSLSDSFIGYIDIAEYFHEQSGIEKYLLMLVDEKDVALHSRYQAIVLKWEMYKGLDGKVRDELDSALGMMGLDVQTSRLQMVESTLSMTADAKLYDDFKSMQADAKEHAGSKVIPIDDDVFNKTITTYAEMKSKGLAEGFWEIVGASPWGLGYAILRFAPLWTALSDKERSDFTRMTVKNRIVPRGWPREPEGWIKAMRALVPYEKERRVIARWDENSEVALDALVNHDFTLNEDFLGDAAHIARHWQEFRSKRSRLINYYRADPDLSSYHDHSARLLMADWPIGQDIQIFMSIYRGMMEDGRGFDWPVDEMYQTVVHGKRAASVHPWISDSDMAYSYHPSDHWFLEHIDQVLREVPRLGLILAGGRDRFGEGRGREAILAEMRERLKRAVPMQRKRETTDSAKRQDAWLKRLSTADLAKAWVILQHLKSSRNRDEIGELLEKDYMDTTTEYGGVFDGAFHLIAPRETGDDGTYVGGPSHQYGRGVAGFHFHSVKEGLDEIRIENRYGQKIDISNNFFSGPSVPDLNHTMVMLNDGIVITRLSDSSFNVDFYVQPTETKGDREEIRKLSEMSSDEMLQYFSQSAAVIDLGVYYHDANRLPRDVASRDKPPAEDKAADTGEEQNLASDNQQARVF
ncbi:MAG: hypothetical protein JW724_04105 [Candidatus Altiarchaeota archaeon]|nr:hypothetical protein [Candidatus Altiarchaeota archaeon]